MKLTIQNCRDLITGPPSTFQVKNRHMIVPCCEYLLHCNSVTPNLKDTASYILEQIKKDNKEALCQN